MKSYLIHYETLDFVWYSTKAKAKNLFRLARSFLRSGAVRRVTIGEKTINAR